MRLPLASHAVGKDLNVGMALADHDADESEPSLQWSVPPASSVLACIAED